MPAPHRLYVGTIGEGLYRSTDGGASFVRACDGMFVECHVRALAVHPNDLQTLYLGTEQGLFCSTDGADNWARVERLFNGLQIWSVLLLPSDPDVIVVMPCGYNAARTVSEFDFAKLPESWRDLPAIRERRIFAVDANSYFSRPGPRLADGVEALARLLHPELP